MSTVLSKNTLLRGSLAAAVMLVVACGKQEEKNRLDLGEFSSETVAVVNGQEISKDVFQAFLRMKGLTDATPAQSEAVLKELIDVVVAAQDAEANGLLDRDTLKAELTVRQVQYIANQSLTEYARANPIEEAEVQAEYALQVGRSKSQEYLLRHILIADEAEARALAKRIADGEAYLDVEKEVADSKGGDQASALGWIVLNQAPAGFAPIVSQLEVGQTGAEPVQSRYGWHILHVEDVRAFEPPKYEEVAQGIRQELGRRKLEARFNQLRQQSSIEISGNP